MASSIVDLGPDDLLLVNYCAIADSGVELARITPSTGVQRWRRAIEPAGMTHSAFYHNAYVQRFGDRLAAVSQGPGIVEVVHIDDGRQRDRGRR